MTRAGDGTDRGAVGRPEALSDLTRAADLMELLVGTPSPTGEEHELARRVQAWLHTAGVEAEVPATDSVPARVVVEATGDGRPRVLLYGQLDSPFTGRAGEDRSLLGDRVDDPEFAPRAIREGDWVRGLGAENPKGYLAAVILAIEALAASGRPRNLQLVVGFCGQAMPALSPGGSPLDASAAATASPTGFGVGCRSMLAAIAPVQHAIVPKPGFAASHDEVGIAIFTVSVRGSLGYTGIRSGAPNENTIAVAARFVTALDAWFATYADEHATSTTRPRGAVVALHGGDVARPAFWPRTTELTVDLRLPPGSEVDDVAAEFRGQVGRIAGELGVEAEVDLRFAIAGGGTDPQAPVVRAAVRAWEALQGERHQPRSGTSGYTDASTLRSLGIDTVRMGMPRPPVGTDAPGFSMGAVHVPSVLVLAEWVVGTVLQLDELSP